MRYVAKSKPRPGDPIPDLVESLLAELGEDPARPGLRATPERVSRALRQLTDGYGVKPEDVIADAVFALFTVFVSTTCCRSSAAATSVTYLVAKSWA